MECRCSNRAAKPNVVRRAQTHRGVGREKPAAGNVSGERVCRRRWPDVLRSEPSRPNRPARTVVGKNLKGTKPADVPLEQPTKFGLLVYFKAARELGLAINRGFLV